LQSIIDCQNEEDILKVMEKRQKVPVVMTIAGSDSGGAAGIQADLRTFAALRVFGTSVITAITAQNPRRIKAILPVKPAMVRDQIESVCDYFKVAAVKTGMLYDESIVAVVAEEIKRRKIPILVVDPVCRATSGRNLLTSKALKTLCAKLLPLATVITPNVPEAEMILGCRIRNNREQITAARELSAKFNIACVIKGGHLPGKKCVDVLWCDGHHYFFCGKRLQAKTHGTGCVFSAALTAYLARGIDMKTAVLKAKNYVFKLILNDKNIYLKE
jgi:hydroxymethylpyrimidine/phosphomethylpyrimidine kinase